ncbi:MAG: c-type cytochrome [Gemmatimonadaceae bacterium]
MRASITTSLAAVALLVGGCRAEGRAGAGGDCAAAALPPRDVAPTPAPPARYGIGREAPAALVKALDIDVNPRGDNLPPGRGTAAEGARVFAAKCAACHGAKGEGLATYPKLIGREPRDFSFAQDYRLPRTVGNYWPYATTIYDYVNRAMPLTAPGSLTPSEVYALTAFLLAENAIIPRDAVMDRTSLPKVKMPARDHFVPDDRAGGAVFR